MSDAVNPTVCPLCGGSRHLGQAGIARVYLLPHRVSLVLMAVGLVLAAVLDWRWLWLSVAGWLLPLVGADLRLLLWPYVAVARVCGRAVNCPQCEPHAGIFRHD